MKSVCETVLGYFEDQGVQLGATEQERLMCDFVAEGHVDSVGILELISEFIKSLHSSSCSDNLETLFYQFYGGLSAYPTACPCNQSCLLFLSHVFLLNLK